jgi:MFS transporter, DHA2 family, methylenomycin A resistance protein
MNVTLATRSSAINLTIAATSLGFALVQLDVSVLNVALARIGAALGTGVTGLQWVVDAYTIAFASLLLAAGALGDRIGARGAYVGGLALFAVASVACGLAPGAGVLIVSRAVQGMGAALLVPCSLTLLTHACGDDAAARGRAISLWTAAATVALSAGPVLGGILVDTLGWRSIFLINVPIGVIGIWLTRRFVAETPAAGGGFDLAGQVLALLTLLSLTGAVIEGGRLGFASPFVLSGLGLAVLCAIGFVAVEARGRTPMLPLGFFRDRTFSAAMLVGLFINLTLYGALFVLGLYLQQVHGYSPMTAGLAFLPFPIALGIANLAAGPIGARFGNRLPMVVGLIVGGVGYWLLRHLDATTPYAAMLPGLVVIPLGVGLAVPLMTSALLSTVPRARSGMASGVLNTVRQAGGGIGVALFGALMAVGGITGIRDVFVISAGLLACAALIAGFGVRSPQRRSN